MWIWPRWSRIWGEYHPETIDCISFFRLPPPPSVEGEIMTLTCKKLNSARRQRDTFHREQVETFYHFDDNIIQFSKLENDHFLKRTVSSNSYRRERSVSSKKPFSTFKTITKLSFFQSRVSRREFLSLSLKLRDQNENYFF